MDMDSFLFYSIMLNVLPPLNLMEQLYVHKQFASMEKQLKNHCQGFENVVCR